MSRWCSGAIVVLFFVIPIATGKETSEIEFMKRGVRVVDPRGEPVKGAKVTPLGFRTVVTPGSYYGWYEPLYGPKPEAVTDENGIAELNVPRFVDEKLEIEKITWIVDSESYVVFQGDRPVTDLLAKVELRSGYRIAATAIDAESKQPIKYNLYAVLSGNRWSTKSEWTLSKKGILISRVFGQDRSVLRLVSLPPNAPPKFSKLISAMKPNSGDRIFLKKTELEKGTRIAGRLDPDVPRPVKNGHALAFVSAGLGDSKVRWSWQDESEIAEDGSFVFASLPKGEIVQLIAYCDGWISRIPAKGQMQLIGHWGSRWQAPPNRTAPQIFVLDSDEISPTVLMDPTATCELKVVDSNGEPIANAEISMWPNHIWFRGGSTILGFGGKTAENLVLARQGKQHIWKWPTRFTKKTNHEGVAVIKELHGFANVGFNVLHDRFDQPINGDSRSGSVDFSPGKTTKITVQMQPKGLDVLGETR